VAVETIEAPTTGGWRRAYAERRDENRRTRSLVLGRSRTATVLAVVLLVVLAVTWLLPLLWAVDTSFKTEAQAQSVPLQWFPDGGFTLENYRSVFERGEVPRWMANTLLIAGSVTVLTVGVCALAGYGFARTRFRGKNLLFAGTIALIAVPGQILIVPLFRQMEAIGAVDTYQGVILPQLVAPVMVYIFSKFFAEVPQEIEDAARVDVAGQLGR
jgi:multiple sugar transport system permease protein